MTGCLSSFPGGGIGSLVSVDVGVVQRCADIEVIFAEVLLRQPDGFFFVKSFGIALIPQRKRGNCYGFPFLNFMLRFTAVTALENSSFSQGSASGRRSFGAGTHLYAGGFFLPAVFRSFFGSDDVDCQWFYLLLQCRVQIGFRIIGDEIASLTMFLPLPSISFQAMPRNIVWRRCTVSSVPLPDTRSLFLLAAALRVAHAYSVCLNTRIL